MRRIAALALAVAVLTGALSVAGATAGPAGRRVATVLSAAWGTDDKVACPTGQTGLDNIPVTFDWMIRPASIQTTDFRIVRDDGTVVTPICSLQFPPDEPDEGQTVNLIGDFGDAADGPVPASVRIVGALEGRAPGARRWARLPAALMHTVAPLAAGPSIVDAWTIPPALLQGDANRCTVGATSVRVVWSNGLTAYPTGVEVGPAVIASYRAVYRRADGRTLAVAPLDVADLHDHAIAFLSDNMHDLCLPRPPRGATLTGVTIGAGLIQDPNGDANRAQRFRLPR